MPTDRELAERMREMDDFAGSIGAGDFHSLISFTQPNINESQRSLFDPFLIDCLAEAMDRGYGNRQTWDYCEQRLRNARIRQAVSVFEISPQFRNDFDRLRQSGNTDQISHRIVREGQGASSSSQTPGIPSVDQIDLDSMF